MVLSLPPPSKWAWRPGGTASSWPWHSRPARSACVGLNPQPPLAGRGLGGSPASSRLRFFILKMRTVILRDTHRAGTRTEWDTVRGGLSTRQHSWNDAGTVPGVNILFSLFRG